MALILFAGYLKKAELSVDALSIWWGFLCFMIAKINLLIKSVFCLFSFGVFCYEGALSWVHNDKRSEKHFSAWKSGTFWSILIVNLDFQDIHWNILNFLFICEVEIMRIWDGVPFSLCRYSKGLSVKETVVLNLNVLYTLWPDDATSFFSFSLSSSAKYHRTVQQIIIIIIIIKITENI